MRRLSVRSPPRMRGKVVQLCGHAQNMGITPACAGKSEKQVPFLPPYQDHPRVCGEKQQMIADAGKGMGSPPRMRGKGVQPCNQRVAVGITPAYAGKRFSSFPYVTQERDHPRVCGEKMNNAQEYCGGQGSPPRVRGKVGLLSAGLDNLGITPAYAGKRADSL